MSCSPCSWQYGVQSPNPSGTLFGGFIRVKMPSNLPNLKCLYVIFASVSSKNYFYQTSLGYSPSYGWHVSAGSTNPQLNCDLACPPFQVNGQVFRPQPNNIYEIGINFAPQPNGVYKVYLYFVDVASSISYNIYTLDDSSPMSTPVGEILESYDINSQDLCSVGNDNSFEIVNTNWLIQPYESTRWPHGYVYGPTTQTCQCINNLCQGYQAVPSAITINLVDVNGARIKIGYLVEGSQYPSGYQLW